MPALPVTSFASISDFSAPRTNKTELHALNPTAGAAGANQQIIAPRANQPCRFSGSQLGQCLGFRGGRQSELGFFLQYKSHPRAGVHAEMRRHAEQK